MTPRTQVSLCDCHGRLQCRREFIDPQVVFRGDGMILLAGRSPDEEGTTLHLLDAEGQTSWTRELPASPAGYLLRHLVPGPDGVTAAVLVSEGTGIRCLVSGESGETLFQMEDILAPVREGGVYGTSIALDGKGRLVLARRADAEAGAPEGTGEPRVLVRCFDPRGKSAVPVWSTIVAGEDREPDTRYELENLLSGSRSERILLQLRRWGDPQAVGELALVVVDPRRGVVAWGRFPARPYPGPVAFSSPRTKGRASSTFPENGGARPFSLPSQAGSRPPTRSASSPCPRWCSR